MTQQITPGLRAAVDEAMQPRDRAGERTAQRARVGAELTNGADSAADAIERGDGDALSGYSRALGRARLANRRAWTKGDR